MNILCPSSHPVDALRGSILCHCSHPLAHCCLFYRSRMLQGVLEPMFYVMGLATAVALYDTARQVPKHAWACVCLVCIRMGAVLPQLRRQPDCR